VNANYMRAHTGSRIAVNSQSIPAAAKSCVVANPEVTHNTGRVTP